MGKISIITIVFSTILSYIFSNSQTEIVHLSFNVCNDSEYLQLKKIESDKELHFYINKEHFKSKDLKNIKNLSSLNDINILDVSSFIELAEKKKKEILNEDQKDGTIKILFNNEVFEKIYLYEKSKNGIIKKYEVEWIEEIE